MNTNQLKDIYLQGHKDGFQNSGEGYNYEYGCTEEEYNSDLKLDMKNNEYYNRLKCELKTSNSIPKISLKKIIDEWFEDEDMNNLDLANKISELATK